MIDVIVVGEEDLEKTLFSISIQTIKDKIHVIVVSSKKHSSLSSFSDILSIEEVITKEKSLGKRRQIGFDQAKEDFVFFMNSGDVFFDVFALNNSYRVMQKNDVVIGGIHNAEKKYSNYYLVGNLYRRSSIKSHRILFSDSDGLENGVHQLLFMAHVKIVFTGDIIYFQKKEMEKDYALYHSLLEDTKYALSKAKTRSYQSREIAKLLYDVLLFFATIFHENKELQKCLLEEIKPILKEYYQYQKYLLEEDYQFISDINTSNLKVDQFYFQELLNTVVL